MNPEVSICVPTFNGAAFVRETVQSVLAQTYSDFELIVMDDASTDDTLDRLSTFSDPRMRVVRGEHVGAIANFNRVIAACRGQFVKLVCGDDTLAPDCLEQQVCALRENPNAVISAGRRDIVDEHGRSILRGRGIKGVKGLVPGADAIALCVRSGTNVIGEPASVLIRASALERAGTWSDEWSYMVDLDLWFRLLHDGDLIAVPKTLATFRVHRGGWSRKLGSAQATQARALFAREAARPEARITRADLLLGAIRAQLLQYGRQIAYKLPRLPGPHYRGSAIRHASAQS